jgi:hypothetical protein
MAAKKLKISERVFQRQVVRLAKLYGWRVAHFRPAQVARGRWLTPVMADGAGFPDLVLVHSRRQLLAFVELKSDSGRIRPEQEEWLADLRAAGIAAFVWRPRDWPAIQAFLTGEQS